MRVTALSSLMLHCLRPSIFRRSYGGMYRWWFIDRLSQTFLGSRFFFKWNAVEALFHLGRFVCGHRPKTKEWLELFLLLILSLFSIWFIYYKRKNLPSRDSNLEPPDPQSGTLPTELRRHSYLSAWKLSTYFKNHAADLGPVLVDTCYVRTKIFPQKRSMLKN